MKIIKLSAVMILTGISAFGQNLIGYNEVEIQRYMRENRKEMNINNVTNHKFKYLKYSDNGDNETLLFFLNSEAICKSVRIICDFTIRAGKVKEFNSIYKKSGLNRWIDIRDGKNYLVEISDDKWSCIISIEPDK